MTSPVTLPSEAVSANQNTGIPANPEESSKFQPTSIRKNGAPNDAGTNDAHQKGLSSASFQFHPQSVTSSTPTTLTMQDTSPRTETQSET